MTERRHKYENDLSSNKLYLSSSENIMYIYIYIYIYIYVHTYVRTIYSVEDLLTHYSIALDIQQN